MEFTIVLKQKLEFLPPVINLIDCLIDLGVEVNLICTELTDLNHKRYANVINIVIIKLPEYKFRPLKVLSIYTFRQKIYNYFNEKSIGKSKNSVIWLASAEAAMAVGKHIANYNYVFQIHELYDKVYHYRYTNGFYFRNSIINICPEANRAAIFRYWYKLNITPSILVNSPYNHPRKNLMEISDKDISSKIDELSGKKLILYMGMIAHDRDISILFKAIKKLDESFHLILLGRIEGDKSKFLDIVNSNRRVSYLGEMSSPAHLQVASHAYIGILSYSLLDLNNLFCAPNKIWEYAGFGIPMLSNEIPGLINLFIKYNSGYSVNFDETNEDEVVEKIMMINSNYNKMSENTIKMFEDFNYKNQLTDILKKISEKIK
jgi:glycosyltransferase involved in cell wall biosynthesis